MNPQQLTIDFTRGDQLAILQQAQLDSCAVGSAGDRIRGATLRAVLRAIDDFGRGGVAWPSIETLAATTGLGQRTIKRAIAALQAQSLLVATKQRNGSGSWSNRYAIVWSELRLRCDRPAAIPASRSTSKPGASSVDLGASLSNLGASLSNPGASLSNLGASLAPKPYRNDQETPTNRPDESAAAGEMNRPTGDLAVAECAALVAMTQGDPWADLPRQTQPTTASDPPAIESTAGPPRRPTPQLRPAGSRARRSPGPGRPTARQFDRPTGDDDDSGPRWNADQRRQVADALIAAGLRTAAELVDECQARGLAADELLRIVSEYQANRDHLRGPGAIVVRVRSGAWPADLPTPAPKPQRSAATVRQQLAESIRFKIIREGRRRGIDDDAIADQLRNAFEIAGLTDLPIWGDR